MATVDFTLEDLKGIFATKQDLERFATKQDLERFATKEELSSVREELRLARRELHEDIGEVGREVNRIATMLQEDARAKSARLDRVERRSLRTQKLLLEHIADKELHRHDG